MSESNSINLTPLALGHFEHVPGDNNYIAARSHHHTVCTQTSRYRCILATLPRVPSGDIDDERNDAIRYGCLYATVVGACLAPIFPNVRRLSIEILFSRFAPLAGVLARVAN
jgi:hypothetical protein